MDLNVDCLCSSLRYSANLRRYVSGLLRSGVTCQGYFALGGGRTGLMVRASDSGSGDPGSILGRVGVFVSLSKRHLLPKSTGNTQE